MKITTIIADDHPVLRDGLKSLLFKDPQIDLLGEAGDGHELLALLASVQPQVVLLDLIMPGMDGLEAAQIIREKYPAVKLIAFSMSAECHFIKEMWHLGVKAYLLKETHPEDLLCSIHTVAAGGTWYSPEILKKIDGFLNGSEAKEKGNGQLQFSQTETRIMELICKGRSGKEISAHIGLAEKTVEHYKERIREKTGAKNATEIAVYAVLHGLVTKEKLL